MDWPEDLLQDDEAGNYIVTNNSLFQEKRVEGKWQRTRTGATTRDCAGSHYGFIGVRRNGRTRTSSGS
jgi:hypothetical protein